MSRILALSALVVALGLALATAPASAVTAPAQFVVENAVPGTTFDTPTAISYLPDGRLLVAEKRGRVWAVTNGVRAATPMIALEAEILNAGDRGLLGLAVDPNHVTNRYVYLLYTVDPDSNSNDNNDDAFGRLTRYQVSATNSNLLDPASRTILMGHTWRTGVASGSQSHTIGDLQFGRDGSLIISTGDGAQFGGTDAGGVDPNLFGPTKTDPFEDIGAFRSQYIGSLAGKILRIDPATGLGYPSNPYYEGNGSSVQSRVWCYGLRNPFRFEIRPGTGSTNPAAGSPGVLYIGDVGYTNWEEQSVGRNGGLNFGWPCYEGAPQNFSFQQATPSHHGCSTMGTAQNPGTYTPPFINYNHSNPSAGSPPGFAGNTAIGGAFYTGTRYPSQYRNQYFWGDYGQNFIKVAQMDANDQLVALLNFATDCNGPVDFKTEPGSGDVMYVAIGTGEVRRIRWTGPIDTNNPPVANAGGSPLSGPAPLTVNFSSAGSSDPDGDPLGYNWNFGNGQTSTAANPVHTYTGNGIFSSILTVTDGRGGLTRDTVIVNVGSGPAGFPTTPVLDAFNRADGAIGGSWVGDVNGFAIAASQATQTCCYISSVWNGGVFGPDQEAYVRFNAVTAGAPEHDLMLKVQGTSYAAGHIEVRYDSRISSIQVSTHTAGTGWTNRGAAIPVTFAAGDQMGARARANGSIEVFKNGVLLATRDAGNWPFVANGGRLGITLDGATSSRLDDFGGGNMVSGGNSPPVASITSPVNGSFFFTGLSIPLSATATDAQDASSALQYHWQVDLHHNTHVHPSTFVADGATSSLTAENHDDGTGVFYRVNIHVTDTGGLKDTATVSVFPEIDLEPSTVATTPVAPTNTDAITYTFKLHNRGRMPAPISRWVLRANAATLAQGDTLIPARDSVTIVRTLPPTLTAGNHVLRIVADSLAAVTETVESNNSRTRTLTITGPPPPPPPSFPGTAVLDNFNRANGAVGGSWVGDVNGFTIVSNQGAQSCCYISSVWNGGIFGADQEAYIRLSAVTAGAPEHDLMLKVQGTSYAAGHIEVRYDSRFGTVQVSTHTATTGWTNRGAAIPVTFAAGDQFGARAYANGNIQVYKNGALLATRSAGTWPFVANGGRLGVTFDGATSSRFDDFGGGNIPPAAGADAIATLDGPTSAPYLKHQAGGAPASLMLSGARPSPSTAGVRFSLELPAASEVEFAVYDLQGREVWAAPSKTLGAGRSTLEWSGSSASGGRVAAGVYLARVTVGAQSLTRRLVLIR